MYMKMKKCADVWSWKNKNSKLPLKKLRGPLNRKKLRLHVHSLKLQASDPKLTEELLRRKKNSKTQSKQF